MLVGPVQGLSASCHSRELVFHPKAKNQQPREGKKGDKMRLTDKDEVERTVDWITSTQIGGRIEGRGSLVKVAMVVVFLFVNCGLKVF